MSISKPAAIRGGSWDQWFEYIAGDVVLGSDGNLYRALSGNTNTNPVGGNATWEYLPLPKQYATTAALLSGAPDYNGQLGSASDGGLAVATGGAFSQAFSIASLTTNGNAVVGGAFQVAGTSTLGLINATGGAVEHSIVNSGTGSGPTNPNVLRIQNNAASGYSTIRICDSGGNEHSAWGFGNGSVGAYNTLAFWEISDATNQGNAPAGVIAQASTFASAQSYGVVYRQSFEQGGNINFYNIANGENLGTTNSTVLQIAASGLTVNLGPNAGAVASAVTLGFGAYGSGGGASINVASSQSTTTFTGFGELLLYGNDQNASIQLRQNTNNINAYYSYGGTLATPAGHLFYTGGLLASQTLKFQVANDVAKAFVPLGVPGYTIAGLPTPPSAGFHAYVTNASQTLASNIGAVVSGTGSNVLPVFYDGTNWRVG